MPASLIGHESTSKGRARRHRLRPPRSCAAASRLQGGGCRDWPAPRAGWPRNLAPRPPLQTRRRRSESRCRFPPEFPRKVRFGGAAMHAQQARNAGVPIAGACAFGGCHKTPWRGSGNTMPEPRGRSVITCRVALSSRSAHLPPHGLAAPIPGPLTGRVSGPSSTVPPGGVSVVRTRRVTPSGASSRADPGGRWRVSGGSCGSARAVRQQLTRPRAGAASPARGVHA